jgi:prepilin-type N-terminal cleavage/methylation domain-containing protein
LPPWGAKGTVPFSLRENRDSPRRGFTLTELLITITIITMLAALSLGGLQAARQVARKAKTRALIVKLDQVITERYESYLTRRVPIRTQGVAPKIAAQMRLDAIRDLIRMEMPERWNDIAYGPWAFSGGPIEEPPLHRLYRERYQPTGAPKPLATAEFGPAECLYMIVSMGIPGAMEHFSQTDIGDVDGDGFPEFLDGWDRPIMFLRWAPGFSPTAQHPELSEIQSGDPVADHDPLDTRQVDANAYHLIPLIYSGGPDKQYDLQITKDYHYAGDPYANGDGAPLDEDGDGPGHYDNIHNHHMGQD